MLAPVSPAGLPGGPDIEPRSPAAEVLFSDLSWRPVTLLAWRQHRQGWAVLIRWPDNSTDWRLA
jgi:hypothetical protein